MVYMSLFKKGLIGWRLQERRVCFVKLAGPLVSVSRCVLGRFCARWVPKLDPVGLRLVKTRNAPVWTSGRETMVYMSLFKKGLIGWRLQERRVCFVKLAGPLVSVSRCVLGRFCARWVPKLGPGGLRLVKTRNAPVWTSGRETMVYMFLFEKGLIG